MRRWGDERESRESVLLYMILRSRVVNVQWRDSCHRVLIPSDPPRVSTLMPTQPPSCDALAPKANGTGCSLAEWQPYGLQSSQYHGGVGTYRPRGHLSACNWSREMERSVETPLYTL